LTAALALAALSVLRRLRLPRPTVRQILDGTGASRSRAYEQRDALLELLPSLERKVGRPRAEPSPPVDTSSLADQVLDFVMQHPGCVYARGQRQRYSDSFRRFLLELCEQHREIKLEAFAAAVHVPWGTLKDWLRGGHRGTDQPSCATDPVRTDPDPATTRRIETIIAEWRRWEGSFRAFCDHVSFDLRIPYGRTLIGSILERHGERAPRRRPGRSPDEKALREAFHTFFPGAQWVGDGTPIEVQIGEQRFGFNLELMVDAHSDAVVGVSTRDQEDSQAVVEAFDDGVRTTDAPPLSVLLDHRACNQSPEVDEGLDPAFRINATKGRAQNKAHVEGAFGLFSQVVPLLAVTATSAKEMARQILMLVVQTWGRTLNHRPRKDRKGRSRVELYTTDTPTPEQIEHARAALQERCRKQELARKTLEARRDPVKRSLLDEAFARLSLADPEGNIRAAIARYPLDDIVAGIATFEGKRDAGTLPDGADARYLLGIVRNISHKDQGLRITEALLRARLEARDRLLLPLLRNLDILTQNISDPMQRLKTLVDLALDAGRLVDRLFWLHAAADHIRRRPESQHSALLRFVSQRIHSTFAVEYADRQAAVRFLCAQVLPPA
jgi:hypothetical protein